MNGLLIVALVVGLPLAYRTGRQHQAFNQARLDVTAAAKKLDTAKAVRRNLGRQFPMGWVLIIGFVLLALYLGRR